MKNWKILPSMLIAGLAVALVMGLSVDARGREGARAGRSKAPGEPRQAGVSTDVITSAFAYQGILQESGEPVSGDREMAFGLYANAACTMSVGNPITYTVPVSEGLFDVDLAFNQMYFDGRALWLQTEVGGTAIGCQPLRAVPYASGLRPGAVISASVGSEQNLMHVRSGTERAGEGVLGAKLGIRTSLGYPVGLYGYAYEYGSVGVWGASDSQFGWGVNGVAQGLESIGVRGMAPALTSTTYGVYGESASFDGYAGYFLNTAVTSTRAALAAQGANGAIITATQGNGLLVSGSGDNAIGDDGVRGVHTGDGVVGESKGTEDLDNGVVGFSAGGYGVYGFSNEANQYGGYFDDPIFVNGGCTGCTTRYVARNTSESTLRKGDVVRAAGVETKLAGAQEPVMQVVPASKGDRVLGVVVGRTEMSMAEPGTDQVQPGAHYGPVEGTAAPGDYLIIVVQGMAQVRLDLQAGIQTGDVVAAGAEGATRAIDALSFGMVLDQGGADGLAWVLVGLD